MLTRRWLIDTAERVVVTAGEAFCGAMLLSGADLISLSAVRSAEVAAVGAGLAALKAAFAALVPSGISPASLAPAPAPSQPVAARVTHSTKKHP